MNTGYICGLCGPHNPGGYGSWAFILVDEHGERLSFQSGMLEPEFGITNNAIEYIALGKLLQEYKNKGLTQHLQVVSTSSMLIDQMRGLTKAKKGSYVPFHNAVKALVSTMSIQISWLRKPLAENKDVFEVAKQQLLAKGIEPVVYYK